MKWYNFNFSILVLLYLIFFACSATSLVAQQMPIKLKADKLIQVNKQNSQQHQLFLSQKNNDSKQFILISFNIDGRNQLFKATNDLKYLQQNKNIIDNIFAAGRQGNSFKWLDKSSGQETMLWEGYLFRYVAEYAYIVSQLPTSKRKNLQIPISNLENVFFKWYNKSKKFYGDDSELQHTRTHIGSHFAVVAMYLSRLSNNTANKNIYVNYYQRYDRALKKNMHKVMVKGHLCYEWNSTWDTPYTRRQQSELKKRMKKGGPASQIQDVSHGNQVVGYIITAYELGLNNWTRNDLQLLANTLKYRIWNPKSKKFSDYINGTNATSKTLKNTGKNQADGWMKLVKYDSSLLDIYQTAYLPHAGKYTGLESQNLQYLGIMGQVK